MTRIIKVDTHAPHLDKPIPLNYEVRKPFGLGDAVAAVAQPIAKVIDAALGTNVKGCGACKARQAYLNSLVPNLRK